MKIGRNEPCPCGSGKKYKKCCLHKAPQPEKAPFPPPASAPAQTSALAQTPAPPPPPQIPPSPPKTHLTLEQTLEELLGRGPLKAPNAVTLNRKIPLEELEETPIIKLLQVYLETIAQKGGTVPIQKDGGLEIDTQLFQETAGRWPGYQPPPAPQTQTSLQRLTLTYADILCHSLGFTAVRKGEATLTEKGRALLDNKQVRKTYTRSLQKMTDAVKWLALNDQPEALEGLQDLSGLMLYLFKFYREQQIPVNGDRIREDLDTFLKTKPAAEFNIQPQALSRLIHDYFLSSYCRLFGFAEPAGKDWQPTALYHQMFHWHI